MYVDVESSVDEPPWLQQQVLFCWRCEVIHDFVCCRKRLNKTERSYMYLFYNDNEGKETLRKEPVCRKQICLSESSWIKYSLNNINHFHAVISWCNTSRCCSVEVSFVIITRCIKLNLKQLFSMKKMWLQYLVTILTRKKTELVIHFV